MMKTKQKYLSSLVRNDAEELKHYIDPDGYVLNAFGPFSDVNILVGATNSGKSRFMRGLAKSFPYGSILIDSNLPTPQYVLKLCQELKKESFEIFVTINPESKSPANYPELIRQINSAWLSEQIEQLKKPTPQKHIWNTEQINGIENLLKALFINAHEGNEPLLKSLKADIEIIRIGLSELHKKDKMWCAVEKKGVTQSIIDKLNLIIDFIDALTTQSLDSYEPLQIIYIPVLRTAMFLNGISSFDANQTDKLAQAIFAIYDFRLESSQQNPPKAKNNKNITPKRQVEVFTGNSLYSIVEKESRGNFDIRGRLGEFKQFLRDNFFAGDKVDLIPANPDHPQGQRLIVSINDRHDIAVKDWGDGIQAIIVMMYRIFTAEDGAWVFIEEPEQGLHPGLQRIFLNCLSNNDYLKSKNLTIFMTTHSNHLLGVALSELEDVSVFSFQQKGFPGPFEIRPIFTPDANLLDLLGTLNTSVFLANCGIWVEGITDRRYLRAFLSAYMKSNEFTSEFKPHEDIHFAFFEYAGSNLAHYLFEADEVETEGIKARFLCNRIFLVADKDKGKDNKHKRIQAMQGDNFVYKVTNGKEVENLISSKQLRNALPKLIDRLKAKDVDNLTLDVEKHRNEGLGTYLKRVLGTNCPKSFAASSGTLENYYKDKLSRIVSEDMAWDEMSQDAQMLAKDLYNFIEKHNHKQNQR